MNIKMKVYMPFITLADYPHKSHKFCEKIFVKMFY